MFTFSDIEITSANDLLIAPDGLATPFAQRSALFQKMFGMTPVEFQKKYHAAPENAFISHGYVYSNGGSIQIESAPTGLTTDQIMLIMGYLNTLDDTTPVDVVLLQHDPQTYQLLNEHLWYTGHTQGLRDKMLGASNMTGSGQEFQAPSEFQYVPSKGGRPTSPLTETVPSASGAPKGKAKTFKFRHPQHYRKTTHTSLTFEGLHREADMGSIPGASRDSQAPESLELMEYHHYGVLPMVKVDNGDEWALATDALADRAAYISIKDSIWAFKFEWLQNYVSLSEDRILALQAESENGNDALWAAIRNKRQFVEDAINSDGRGNFLSSYDGREHTLNEFYLRVVDLPHEVLQALRINENYADDIYVYIVNQN